LTEEIEALGFESERVYANTESRTISVTGTPYMIEQARRRINVIDKPVSQCLIVAQLIEISHGKNVNLGFQYSLPTYSHTGTTTGKTTDDSFRGNWLEKLTFSASATASKELANGKVISRPMIMVLNGQEGSVNFGDQVPVMRSTSTTASTEITVDYKDVGTKLAITPAIDEASGEITMKIKAEVSNISRWVTSGQTTAPQIATRQAITSAHLRSGQSFVIGGLMSVSELDNLSGIPGLMDLPILGALFRYHSKSKTYAEIYIMLTPYIVTDDIDPSALLRRAGGGNYGGN
ncbi:MAG: type II and III secretion system protein, partial [Schwartzia sp.]|nr:type II and III secretion system protein [Schwartzia sp. (in: firmicutes)]